MEKRKEDFDRRAIIRESTDRRSPIVKWSNTYLLGIKIIDDQHKDLLDFVNDIYSHSAEKEDEQRVYFKGVISKVVEYVKVHFATEEKIMLATKFPGYSEHKKNHEAFILKIVEAVKDFEAGKRLVLTNFSSFLKDWILTHIAVKDVKYRDHLKQIATRNPDGTLNVSWIGQR